MHFHDTQIFGYLVYVHCSKPISEAYPSVLGNADDVPAAFLCPFHTSIYGSNELEHGLPNEAFPAWSTPNHDPVFLLHLLWGADLGHF